MQSTRGAFRRSTSLRLEYFVVSRRKLREAGGGLSNFNNSSNTRAAAERGTADFCAQLCNFPGYLSRRQSERRLEIVSSLNFIFNLLWFDSITARLGPACSEKVSRHHFAGVNLITVGVISTYLSTYLGDDIYFLEGLFIFSTSTTFSTL